MIECVPRYYFWCNLQGINTNTRTHRRKALQMCFWETVISYLVSYPTITEAILSEFPCKQCERKHQSDWCQVDVNTASVSSPRLCSVSFVHYLTCDFNQLFGWPEYPSECCSFRLTVPVFIQLSYILDFELKIY